MDVGQLPLDDNKKPVLGVWDDATGKVFPLKASSTVVGTDGKTYAVLSMQSYVGSPVADYGSNPSQTAAAGADTLFKWGSDGATVVHHLSIQNNTGAAIFYAFDQSSVTVGNKIYTLQDKQLATWDRSCTTLHFSSAAQQSFGGQSGITVEAFL